MRDVFADTSFYVALVNVRDALHEKAGVPLLCQQCFLSWAPIPPSGKPRRR